jgi:DNA-binding MarR family transcriptional regulator
MESKNECRNEGSGDGAETKPRCSNRGTDGLVTDGGQSAALAECTTFQYDCLAAIRAVESLSAAASDREVKHWLEDSQRCNEVDYDRLSRDLDTLVDNGYVERSVSRRRTCTYRTTDLGDRAFAQRQTDAESETGESEADRGTAVADD